MAATYPGVKHRAPGYWALPVKRSRLAPVGLALALLIAAPAASAGVAAQPEPLAVAADGDVLSVATNGSRTLVTGDFGWIGQRAPGLTITSAIGGGLERLVAPAGFSGDISKSVADGQGGWYRAGTQLSHIRADGTVDPAFNVKLDAYPDALALTPDGRTLFVAGYFEEVGGQPSNGLAAIDTATGTVKPWTAAVAPNTWSLAVSPGGATVYAAGELWVDDHWRAFVALDAQTGAVRGYGPQDWFGDRVIAGPELVYASMEDEYDGAIAAVDPATLTTRWQVATDRGGTIGLARGRLFVDNVSTVAGQPREGGAALDAATGALTDWTSVGPLNGMQMAPGGEWFYATVQPYDDDVPSTPVAISTYDGAQLGFPGGGVAFSADGRHMLGGGSIGRRFVSGSALLDETSAVLPWAGEPDAAYGDADDSALGRDGTAYVARAQESFDRWRTYVTAVGADGVERWKISLDGYVTLTLSPDEQTVYLTGSFTSINGASRSGLAAVRASDGALDPWAPVATGGTVGGASFSPDGGTLYVSGSFTTFDGAARRGVVALDAASRAVLPFDAGVDGTVSLVRVAPDGSRVYLAGAFTHAGGGDAWYVAGVTLAGALVWTPPVKAPVHDLAPLPDGRTVAIAANFDPTSSVYDDMIPVTLWDARTGARVDWDPLACYACSASKLVVDAADGRLHIIGEELPANGNEVTYVRFSLGLPSAPTNTAPPVIVGGPESNTWVECDPGHWQGHPTEYHVSWLVDGVQQPLFDGRDFLLTDADIGHSVACEVDANAGTPARSAPITVTPGDLIVPAPRRDPVPPGGPTPTPTASPSPSPTPSASPSPTPSPSPSPTPSASPSSSPTATASPSPSPTASPTPSPSPTPTPTATPSPGASPTPTASARPTPSSSPGPDTSPSPAGDSTPRTPIPLPSANGDPPPAPATLAPPGLGAALAADRAAPRVSLRRAGRNVRVTLSEGVAATVTLRAGRRTTTRRFSLNAGRHTLTPKRLSGRARLPRGRYTLTLTARDAAGNETRRVLRFRV
jgi:hypothetical protein